MKPLCPLTLPLSGRHLIEASAGTGKTYNLATLYLRLLVEKRLAVRQILVVTFTIAATADLRANIRRRLREAVRAIDTGECDDPTLMALLAQWRQKPSLTDAGRRLTAALCDFDQAAIWTIHSFCARILEQSAFESHSPFAQEMVPEAEWLRREVVFDFWAQKTHDAPELLLRSLPARQIDPEALDRLAQRVTAQPQIHLLPEAVDENAGAYDLQLWERCFAQAAELWRREAAVVMELLCSAPKLNRRRLSVEAICRNHVPMITQLLATPTPGAVTAWKASAAFTPRGLSERTNKGGVAPEHPFFAAWEALLSADQEITRQLDSDILALQWSLAVTVRTELRARLQRQGLRTFTDLLTDLYQALHGSSGTQLAAEIRSRFPAALIDEFQDTDVLQYGIFHTVYGAASDLALFLIGDPKQAIYAFRGADIFAYLAAKRDIGARCHTLDVNWRSDPGYLAALNALFARARAPFLFDDIAFRPASAPPGAKDLLLGAGAPLRILFVDRGNGAATRHWGMPKDRAKELISEKIADDIARLLASGARRDGEPLRPSDIAVLLRTNDEAHDVQRALVRVGVPSVLTTEADIFCTPEAEQAELILAAMASPTDNGAVRAALTTEILGTPGEQLAAGSRPQAAEDEWVERFCSWQRIWVQDGIYRALSCLLADNHLRARLLAAAHGKRQVTNFLHLAELLQRAAAELRLGPHGLRQWLGRVRRDPSLRPLWEPEATRLRLETDEQAVVLVTVHKSKGMQYPIVYCPFMWNSRRANEDERRWVQFHDPAHDDRLSLDMGAQKLPEHRALAEREAMAESLRVLYVALTRAEHQCHLVWGRLSSAEKSALGYLLHQAPDGADLVARTQKRILKLDERGMWEELAALAESAGGTIEVVDLVSLPPSRFAATKSAPQDLRARRRLRDPFRPWGTISFSSITAGDAPLGVLARQGLDDAATTPSSPSQGIDQQPVLLADFPAGSRAGLMVHDLLEHLDFTCSAEDDLYGLVDAMLRRYGFSLSWRAPLLGAIKNVLTTPLGGLGNDPELTLQSVSVSRRLNELEFVFPVGAEAAAQGIVDLLLAEGKGLCARFGERLQQHPRHCLAGLMAGHLRGFIDLVVEHHGRFYLIDYKTNFLGRDQDDYQSERLAEVMLSHQYPLQYLLYVVALHRYLGQRLPGYEYERHFGGVFYLFVRGMAPSYPTGNGVFYHRPAEALVVSLSQQLKGAA